jgi:hypothetical protein
MKFRIFPRKLKRFSVELPGSAPFPDGGSGLAFLLFGNGIHD